jgi:hypothetical protein
VGSAAQRAQDRKAAGGAGGRDATEHTADPDCEPHGVVLALEVAAQVAADFPDGAVFVDLAPGCARSAPTPGTGWRRSAGPR